jgi:hypothetical protein
MLLFELLPEESDLVLACLEVVATGHVIPHDWEFQTLMGVSPEEFIAVAKAWPRVEESNETVRVAISNTLNSLLHLVPDELLNKHVAYEKSQIAAILTKLEKL